MARVKDLPSMESVLFATPEQKILRFLMAEPTTSFTPRVISSKLKGVRGLGGLEGITATLETLHGLGWVDYVDNKRAVRLHAENGVVETAKRLAAVCELESLCALLGEVASRGILFGSRASGRYRSDSDFDLFIVSDRPEEVRRIVESHPLVAAQGKVVETVIWPSERYPALESEDPRLHQKLLAGVTLWP
jgi:predicted nucleotidyltransferase